MEGPDDRKGSVGLKNQLIWERWLGSLSAQRSLGFILSVFLKYLFISFIWLRRVLVAVHRLSSCTQA